MKRLRLLFLHKQSCQNLNMFKNDVENWKAFRKVISNF